MPTRRMLLSTLLLAACETLAHGAVKRAPRLLVHGGWRSDSMADLAQLSGLLVLLQREMPELRLIAWTHPLSKEVQGWLSALFPKIDFVTGTTGTDGSPDDGDLAKAWKKSDFLLHGTGGGVLAPEHLRGWKKHSGKPFGLYGVTLPAIDGRLVDLLSAAKFLYLRDGISRSEVLKAGVTCPVVGFVPDAAFAMPWERVEALKAAETWLQEAGCVEGPFICVAPRLRHVPHWELFSRAPYESELPKVAENERCKATDMKLLAAALTTMMGASGDAMKLIVITEHPYEAALAKDYLLPAFEAKFRARVLLKETVDLPDVTAALFSKAKLVMSMDFGVAQMAVTAGTAAIHLRLPQDDSKGQLWRDVGMPDSILEFTSITGTSLSRHAMAMMDDPQMQSKVMSEALSYIKATEGEAVASIRKSLFD